MPPRYRFRPNEHLRVLPSGSSTWELYPGQQTNEAMWDFNPGGGSCTHIKRKQALHYYSPLRGYVENMDVPYIYYAPPPLVELDWANLPSSSELNIITLLAEMDDIIATLTWKFWRQLSYGAVTWGIVPLISEIKSGLKALQNIAKSIDGTQYEATTYDVSEMSGHVGGQWHYMQWNVKKSVKYHAYGKAYYDDLLFSSILDKIGFHPDLATLWELVPFSFVVDYIFPIGKFLEGLRRGGWVKAVYFDGWVSASVNSAGYMYAPDWAGFEYTPKKVPFEYNTYFRYPHSSVLVAPEATLPQFELPTFEEVFNMAYLANKKLQRVVPPVHWDWLFDNEDD